MNKKKTKAYMFIPDDADAKAIMHRRALICAETHENETVVNTGCPYIKFRLGLNELYGIEFSSAKGTLQTTNLRKPPNVSPVICGLINYQGKLIGVIDLEMMLNIQSEEKDVKKVRDIIIVSSEKMIVGMSVGEIEMSDSYLEGSLTDSLLSHSDIQQGFIKGIDKGKISILNVDKLLASVKITEGEVL